jgi:hypothetical protein
MAANLTIGTVWIDVSISERHSLSAEVTTHPVERGTDIVDHIRPMPREIQIEGFVTNHPIEPPLSHAGGVTASEDAGFIDVTTAPGRRLPPMSVEIEGEPTDYGLGSVPGFGQASAIASIPGALGFDVSRPLRKYAAEYYVEDREGRTFYAVNALAFSEDFNRVDAVRDALQQIVENAQPVKLVTGLDIYEAVALSDLSFDRSRDVGPNALRFSATCKVIRMVSAETVVTPKPVEARGKPQRSRGKQQTAPTPVESLPPVTKAQLEASMNRSAPGFAAFFTDTPVAPPPPFFP